MTKYPDNYAGTIKPRRWERLLRIGWWKRSALERAGWIGVTVEGDRFTSCFYGECVAGSLQNQPDGSCTVWRE